MSINIPTLWLGSLASNSLGPASVIRQFIRKATEAGREFVPEDAVVSARDAVIVYMLVRSRGHAADIGRLERLSGINAGGLFFVALGLEGKGLVSVVHGDEVILTLTENGRELVGKCL